jgi:hypothetical protein
MEWEASTFMEYEKYWCNSSQHLTGRRQFLGTALAGLGTAAGVGLLAHPLGAGELTKQGKSLMVIWLAGGISQFESWDPKSDVETGGPFKAIPTTVPGIHISELLPHTAMQMHHMALIRSINTTVMPGADDHGISTNAVRAGRLTRTATDFPELGAAAAKALDRDDFPLPGHIFASAGGSGGRQNNAAYLGPKYAGVTIGAKDGVINSVLPNGMTVSVDGQRNSWRRFVNDRFQQRHRSAQTDAFTQSYEQALQLMNRREIFDVSREPQTVQDRYGSGELGRQLLLARRLLENEVPYVEVRHDGWDFHHNNFEFHIHYVADFDRPFSIFLSDLAERGLLERTLVVVMTEFGRTPKINPGYGRDHWPNSWSVALAGCGIHRGAVIGKTNDSGTEVVDRQVDHRHLFHTYLRAVGVDSAGEFNIGGRSFPIADTATGPIEELLT